MVGHKPREEAAARAAKNNVARDNAETAVRENLPKAIAVDDAGSSARRGGANPATRCAPSSASFHHFFALTLTRSLNIAYFQRPCVEDV